MAESFREKYGKKILFWIAVGLVALGIAQPNFESGVTEKKTDLIRAVSNDEYHQKCGPARAVQIAGRTVHFRDCLDFYQAYCTYFTAFQLKKHQWSFFTKYPALSKSPWARPGTPLIEIDSFERKAEVISTGFYAGHSSWPTRQEAFDDIEKSCPLFWWQYNSQYRRWLLFPASHKFVIPYIKLGSRSLGPTIT